MTEEEAYLATDMNRARADRIERFYTEYADETGSDRETFIVDVISDLMHWNKIKGVNLDCRGEFFAAAIHFDTEKKGHEHG